MAKFVSGERARLGAPAAVALAIGVLLTTSFPATAATKLSVSKVANDFALMMGDYGKKLGIFQKHGLDIEISLITQAKTVQAFVAGSIDISLASGSTIAFAAKGAPFKAVAAIDGPPELLVLVVPVNGVVKTLDDLKGRTAAVTNTGSLTDWAVSQIALMKKWPTTDIKRVSVGDTPSRVAALKTGAADAAVMDISAAYQLEERGEARILANFGDLIEKFQNQVIYASDAIIKKNPEAVRAFNTAFIETLEYARKHRDETVAFTKQELNVSQSVAEKVYDRLMNDRFFSRDGQIADDVLDAMSTSFVDLKLLDRKVDLSTHVNRTLLPKR